MTLLDEIRRFWDEDATTYDNASNHQPRSPAVLAAWTAAMEQLLPPAPSRVLDCGAGTGFLSLIAARLGHDVTALDIAEKMLERLADHAARQELKVTTIEGPATEPPPGPFDAVIERHLVWTLPDPVEALQAWSAVAPGGRLVLVESMWGRSDPVEAVRWSARHLLHRMRGIPPDHHGSYPPDVRAALPLASGPSPGALVELVARSGWTNARLERLRDIEWAMRSELRPVERMLGVSPRFAVVASSPAPAARRRPVRRRRNVASDERSDQ